MHTENHHGSAFGTWIIVILLVLLVFAQGAFSFLVVYAIYEPLPYPQHIRGQKGE
jgi:hypothetical protein